MTALALMLVSWLLLGVGFVVLTTGKPAVARTIFVVALVCALGSMLLSAVAL